MGNDHSSHLPGVEIDQKSVEVADFWSHHSASLISNGNMTNLSVLISELFVDGPLWTTRTPLEKNSKNLMIYRHPCIVKYISSWQKNSKYYLAIEEVMPLSLVLPSQNTLQICIGLYSILKALCFLHETAQVTHNNICMASIYVSKDGNWKLGSMEYLCRFSDLTTDYLKKSKTNRYNKTIDPNEVENLMKSSRKDCIDIYAFGALVCEIIKGKSDDEIPSLTNFRDLCKNDLQNINPMLRPKLHDLLQHDFFNHDFITIHSFLVELPLHSDEEKTQFFRNLTQRLCLFTETTVASQLGSLLLSRLVLLNKTAQDDVLPSVLCPRLDNGDSSNVRLFSEDTFKQYLVPRLLEIFCVRDAQIRLLLLNYFPQFMHSFTKDELQSCILPELLVGVKDTNDHLVSVTLRTLADLVPILGATTVIGGKRAKLFNDGRPILHQNGNKSSINTKKPSSSSHEINDNSNRIAPVTITLPERPRPDGEEGETSTEEIEQSVGEDLDNWEDWDLDNNAVGGGGNLNSIVSQSESIEGTLVVGNLVGATTTTTTTKRALPDISELDIKNQTKAENNEDVDFFQDMEPVIETSSKYLIVEDNKSLNLGVIEDTNEDGWVDEEW